MRASELDARRYYSPPFGKVFSAKYMQIYLRQSSTVICNDQRATIRLRLRKMKATTVCFTSLLTFTVLRGGGGGGER